MGRRKGSDFDPHLHLEKYSKGLFYIFDSCSTNNNKCDSCEIGKDLCRFLFDVTYSWGAARWNRAKTILELREKGISIVDIAKEVKLGKKDVSQILAEISKTKLADKDLRS